MKTILMIQDKGPGKPLNGTRLRRVWTQAMCMNNVRPHYAVRPLIKLTGPLAQDDDFGDVEGAMLIRSFLPLC